MSKKLLVYLTAGFPTNSDFLKIVNNLDKWGVAAIEIGIPFSDPIADGPTIQKSSAVALKNKINLEKVRQLLRRVRTRAELIVMSYFNPLNSYGLERFARDFSILGVKKVIIPDILPEEAQEPQQIFARYGLGLIYLIAPTTPALRVQMISRRSSGFVYVVSVRGVTGARKSFPGIKKYLRKVRRNISQPIYLGFGISSPEQIRNLKRYADGFIVGSAIIDIINSGGKWFGRLKNFIHQLSLAAR